MEEVYLASVTPLKGMEVALSKGFYQSVQPSVQPTEGSRVLVDQYSCVELRRSSKASARKDLPAGRVPRRGVLRKSAGRRENSMAGTAPTRFPRCCQWRAAAREVTGTCVMIRTKHFRRRGEILAGSLGPHTLLALSKGDPAHSVPRFGQGVFVSQVSGHVVRIFSSVSGSNP